MKILPESMKDGIIDSVDYVNVLNMLSIEFSRIYSKRILFYMIALTAGLMIAFYQMPPVLSVAAIFLAAYYATNGEMVTHQQMIVFSFVYMVISLVALLLSIPYWHLLALVP